MQSKEKEKERA